MTLDQLLARKRDDILAIAAKHGASNVRIFGSVARGTAGPESDVDVLVDLRPGTTLLGLAALINDLEDLLQRDVDVVTERGLRERVRADILRGPFHFERT
jgi:predicted nucleotidyltransferase